METKVPGADVKITYLPDSPFNHEEHKVTIEPESKDKDSLIAWLRAELNEKETKIADLEESLRTVKNSLTFKSAVAAMREKRIEYLKSHIKKLKQLILLTDPAVHNVEMNDLTTRQWTEYRKWCIETEGVSHALS